MNLPSLSKENLPRIQAGLDFCAKNSIPWVRINIGMAELCKGEEIDLETPRLAGELCKQYGRQIILVDYTQLPNTKCVRKLIGGDDAALWSAWKHAEELGLYQDCHNQFGIMYSDTALDISDSIVKAFEDGYGGKVGIRQIENEPGETVNARRNESLPYGYVSQPIHDYIEFKTGITCLTHYIAAPAWETEGYPGLMEQIRAEDKRFWGDFDRQSLNWYLTKWKIGDTPTLWAKRAVKEIRSFCKNVWWPGRPLLISELGAIGCPKDLRLACFKAFEKSKTKSWIVCWHDFDSPEWGMV